MKINMESGEIIFINQIIDLLQCIIYNVIGYIIEFIEEVKKGTFHLEMCLEKNAFLRIHGLFICMCIVKRFQDYM